MGLIKNNKENSAPPTLGSAGCGYVWVINVGNLSGFLSNLEHLRTYPQYKVVFSVMWMLVYKPYIGRGQCHPSWCRRNSVHSPNVNTRHLFCVFWHQIQAICPENVAFRLRFNGPKCLHTRKFVMQFPMQTQGCPNNDSVGFQSLWWGGVRKNATLESWNHVMQRNSAT